MKRFLFAAIFAAAPLLAQGGQVGHDPKDSPYLDVDYKQEVTAFAGYFNAARDPAGVAPQNAPMFGLRYDVHLAGPAQFTVKLAQVFSDRTVLDPSKPRATRVVGTQNAPLMLGDVGFTMNLTGQKSIHHFVPLVGAGLGVASQVANTAADTGGYRFGTAFAFNLGTGVKWIPGGRFQLRADVQDYLYSIKYPTTYYDETTDQTAVLASSQTRSVWKHNGAFTIGGSYLFFR